LKEISLGELLEKKPTKALELAVVGMLPKNKLKKAMISRLKLFTTSEHNFTAQKPEEIFL
jgi:large subunit ribosomal protein L13